MKHGIEITKWRFLLLFFPAVLVLVIICYRNQHFVSSLHDNDPKHVPSEILEPPSAEFAEVVEQARRSARRLIIDDNLPGLSIAVSIDNEIVWAEGFGWADLKQGIPVTPETQFRIGTTTISFTAASVGLLYERGLIDLDVQVQEYVPEFPKKQWEISTRQLMGHVSGIRHLRDGAPLQDEEPFSRKHYNDVIDSLEEFQGDPLLFRPSTAYGYSTWGWVLVGAVVQAAGGEQYSKFMESEIFQPLGMKSTVPDIDDEDLPNLARFYWPSIARKTKWGLENATEADLSGKLPSEGYISTPIDLVRFGNAVMDGSLLSSGTVEMLFTEQVLTSGETTGAGLGWEVSSIKFGDDQASSPVLSCPGHGVGGTTSFMIFPEQRMVLAVVSNVSFANGLEPFAVNLARVFGK